MVRILHIEEDPNLRSLLRYNLEERGYAVTESDCGLTALNICVRERPDLIRLDMLLPDADGLEVCRAIRRHPQFRTLPIVFLTTRATETDRRACLQAGATDFLAEPFSIRELMSRIGR